MQAGLRKYVASSVYGVKIVSVALGREQAVGAEKRRATCAIEDEREWVSDNRAPRPIDKK